MTQDELADELRQLGCTDVTFADGSFDFGHRHGWAVSFMVGRKTIRHAVIAQSWGHAAGALKEWSLEAARHHLQRMAA